LSHGLMGMHFYINVSNNYILFVLSFFIRELGEFLFNFFIL
jgi:hypothetical protein